MAFDTGPKGTKYFPDSGSITFAPGCPYDAMQFILAYDGVANAADSVAIEASPDGSLWVPIPGSPWAGDGDKVIQTVTRATKFRLTFTKAVNELRVFVDAVEYNDQQSKSVSPYKDLVDGGPLTMGD